jgi:hypothetical protein
MAAKLTLLAAPTFTASPEIPVAGQAQPVPVPMTFKHRPTDELLEWDKKKGERTDLQTFLDMVVGWGLEDDVPDSTPPQTTPVPFNEANAAIFLKNYGGAAYATYLTYLDELLKARRKN